MNSKNEKESPKWYLVGAVIFLVAGAVWAYSASLSGRQSDMLYVAIGFGTAIYCGWKYWKLKKEEKN